MKKYESVDPGSSKRLRRAGATLLFMAAFTVFAVAGSKIGLPALPVSAKTAGMIYAISYRDADSPESSELLIDDAEYMRKIGLDIILPRDIDEGGGGAILILEGAKNVRETAKMLENNGLHAVFLAQDVPEEERQALYEAWEKGIIEPAAPIGKTESPCELVKQIAEAKLAFFTEYSIPCSVFVHSCSSIVCNSCFSSAPPCVKGVKVFLFGDGRNDPPAASDGFIVLDRIVRLEDWSIDEYFAGTDQN